MTANARSDKQGYALLTPIRSWLRFAAAISLVINALLLATPIYMLQIFDRVLVSGSMYTLLMLTAITVVMIVAHGVLDMVRGRLLARAGYVLEHDLGPRVLDRVHDYRLAGQDGRGAEYMRDVVTLRNYLSSQHLISIFDSPWAPIFTLLIFSFSWVLGVVTLIGVAALLLLALLDEKITYGLFSRANGATTDAWQFANNSVRNSEIIHALGMKATMLGLWRGLAGRALGQLKYATDRSTAILAATKFVRTSIQVAMLGVGAYLVIAEHLSPGIMIAGTIIIARAIAPVEGAISGWKTFIEARNAYARLSQLLGETRDAQSEVALPAISGRIELQHVYFGFGPGNMLLNDVSFKLEPGQALGLVGPSGAGKSTLARILLGLIEPQQGKVLLDGYDIRHYDRGALGGQLGYLPQNIELFEGTIAQNVARMQEPGAHSEAIVGAAGMVGLQAILARFPEGFQTRLAPNGVNLSGGQRQAVGLARALFGNPRMVVLDEPDASLDEKGEERLARLIAEIRARRDVTLVVISHNPKIVEHMDYLLLVQDGGAKLLERTSKPTASPGAAVPPLPARTIGV